MEKLKYFYRPEEDGFIFKKFGKEHFLVFLFLICIALFIFIFKDNLKKNKEKQKVLKTIFLFLLVFQQINFIYFFVFVKKTGVYESLPLYTCRFAIYTSILAILTDEDKFKGISVYLGIVGSFIAFLSPNLDKYSFPHVMFFNYFLTHFLIYTISLYYILIEEYTFSKKGLKSTLYILNLYLIFTLIIDKILNTNYSYLRESPVLTNKFNTIPKTIYTLFVFLIYNLSIILCHDFFKKIKIKENKWKKKI